MTIALWIASSLFSLWLTRAAWKSGRRLERERWIMAIEDVGRRAHQLCAGPWEGAAWALLATHELATGQKPDGLDDARAKAFGCQR